MTGRTFLAVLAVVATAGVASAQTTPPAAPASATSAPQAPAGRQGRGRGPQGAGNPTAALITVQDMLDGYVLKQAQNALQLSDDQFLRFLPKMAVLQKLRRQHQRQHTQLINQLNQAAPAARSGAPSADEATIIARVKAVDDAEAQMVTDEHAALAAVDSVLTVYQRARFRVFEENMEREKLRLLAKVMAQPQNNGPASAPAPRRGGGHR